MKKAKHKCKFNDKDTENNRSFPVRNTFFLVIIVLVQFGLGILWVSNLPKPQNVIHQYNVTVEPQADGSLDIEYHLVLERLDKYIALTSVEIGMANENFYVYPDSVSSNIDTYSKYTENGSSSLGLVFKEAYLGSDVFALSFKVNQKDMLHKNENGYFYAFVPGWFNAMQVKEYKFLWLMDGSEDYVQQGSLDYGEYSTLTVRYGLDDFIGCQTVAYRPFDESRAYNAFQEDVGFLNSCCLIVVILIIPEVNIVYSYVSFVRGRGFLTGYGYHVHISGRPNPHFLYAQRRFYNAHFRRKNR